MHELASIRFLVGMVCAVCGVVVVVVVCVGGGSVVMGWLTGQVAAVRSRAT